MDLTFFLMTSTLGSPFLSPFSACCHETDVVPGYSHTFSSSGVKQRFKN